MAIGNRLSVDRGVALWCMADLVGLAGYATRPVNPPIAKADPSVGYTFQTRQKYFKNPEVLVVPAFSGEGTRAAALSY